MSCFLWSNLTSALRLVDRNREVNSFRGRPLSSGGRNVHGPDRWFRCHCRMEVMSLSNLSTKAKDVGLFRFRLRGLPGSRPHCYTPKLLQRFELASSTSLWNFHDSNDWRRSHACEVLPTTPLMGSSNSRNAFQVSSSSWIWRRNADNQ